jgi:hypothetical protein
VPIGRYKHVIDGALRSCIDRAEVTEVFIAVATLNRILALQRPKYVQVALAERVIREIRSVVAALFGADH